MSISLKAELRKKEDTGKTLRLKGFVPCIVYGPEIEPKMISIDLKTIEKTYRTAGESNLIDLAIGAEAPLKVLFQEIQREPVTDQITHIDFRQINMNKPIHAKIPLVFVGEPPVVKELAGTLVTSVQEVEVKCLPKDLISSITVDVTVLKTFNDYVRVKDLKVPAGIEILLNPETIVATAVAVTEEEVEKGPKSIEEIEVVGKKKETEEGADAEAGKDGDKKPEAKKPEAKK